MSALLKGLVIAGLALAIFGGGGLLSYELFFKKKDYRERGGGVAVATATPDLVSPMLAEARRQLSDGNPAAARGTLLSIIQAFPQAAPADEARRVLGDLNLHDFFSPGPDKTEYTVVRGDSIGRIAAKTKASPELIFKANGLTNLNIQPGRRFIVPSGQFSVAVDLKRQTVTLLDRGAFFKWYKPAEFKAPPRLGPGQYKVSEKVAWSGGTRVAFGDKHYLGSSRWIMTNFSGLTIFSESNPAAPNVQKPLTGIMLGPSDLEELFALVVKNTPVVVQ